MQQVAALSKGIVEDHRRSRKNSLKRTFVTATDAIQHRYQAPGQSIAKKIHKSKEDSLDTIEIDDDSDKDEVIKDPIVKLNEAQKKLTMKNLLKDVIYFDIGDFCNNISKTTSTMGKQGKFEINYEESDGVKSCYLIFNGMIVAEGSDSKKKVAKKNAELNLVETLTKYCYTIKVRIPLTSMK